MALASDLIEQRPLLVNSVLLRQNPHVVFEWLKRTDIVKEKGDELLLSGSLRSQSGNRNSISAGNTTNTLTFFGEENRFLGEDLVDATFREAVKKVDPFRAVGRVQDLWIAWAKYREACGSDGNPDDKENISSDNNDGKLAGLRKVYTIATREGRFAHADEIAGVWCEWIETELAYGNYDYALHLARQSLSAVPKSESKLKQVQLSSGQPNVHVKTNTSTANGNLSANSVTGKQFSTAPVQTVQKSGAKSKKQNQSQKQSQQRDPADETRSRALRSKKLWYLALDLEENFGTFETLKSTYERMIELKIATPQTLLNFAALLEEHKFFEESFRVYERGVTLFRQPHCHDLWLLYLVKFMSRYKVTKLERSRDLFEQAIISCSESMVMQMRLHILYGKLEERYGLARRSLEIYQQGCDKISKLEEKSGKKGANKEKDEKNQDDDTKNSTLKSDLLRKMWSLLIVRTGEIKGGQVAREVLNTAVNSLPEGDALVHFGLLYAELETSFGELARARGIYEYISEFCDPRRYPKFWEIWQVFELRHGSSDTFREMKRIQRAIQAAYAQVHFNAPDISASLDDLKPVGLDPIGEAEAKLRGEVEEDKAAGKGPSESVTLDKAGRLFLQKREELLEQLGTYQLEKDSFFEECERFTGYRPGYVFKLGIKGLGFYEDLREKRKNELKMGGISTAGQTVESKKRERSRSPSPDRKPSPKRVKTAVKSEEIELDMDDDDDKGNESVVKTEETEVVPKKKGALDKFRKKKG